MKQLEQPEPGYYKFRRGKGAPWSPCLIYIACPIDPNYGFPMQRSRVTCAMLDGYSDANPYLIWPWCRPISFEDYVDLVRRTAADLPVPEAPTPNLAQAASLF